MSEILDEKLIEALADTTLLKVLATADDEGRPHAVFKEYIAYLDSGNLIIPEGLEKSKSGSNLVHSLWFGREAVLAVNDGEGREWLITCLPYKCHITGSVFEEYYKREPDGLSAVWEFVPKAVTDESYESKKADERKEHPLFMHLDLLVEGAGI